VSGDTTLIIPSMVSLDLLAKERANIYMKKLSGDCGASTSCKGSEKVESEEVGQIYKGPLHRLILTYVDTSEI